MAVAAPVEVHVWMGHLGGGTMSSVQWIRAAVCAVAERMGAARIYTLSRGHFEHIRPVHVARFELLPE